MSLLVWVSLAVLVTAAAGGAALVVLRAIQVVRAARSSGRVVAAAADRIVNAADVLGQRAPDAGSERLATAVERLQQSLRSARVLARELRRAQALLSGARSAVPKK